MSDIQRWEPVGLGVAAEDDIGRYIRYADHTKIIFQWRTDDPKEVGRYRVTVRSPRDTNRRWIETATWFGSRWGVNHVLAWIPLLEPWEG